MTVFTNVDLHEFDLPVELAVRCRVVRRDGHPEVIADVRGLVSREDHRLCRFHSSISDGLAVVEESHVAALGQPTTVVGKLHTHLMCTGRYRLTCFSGIGLEAQEVVDEFCLAT